MKVCVIDDDPLMLEQSEMLTAMGFEVVTARDVDTGVAITRAQQADPAVIDILMADRDGLNFILEAQRKRPDLRIVAITGGDRLGAGPILCMADGLGADATFVKPFSAGELSAALAEHYAANRFSVSQQSLRFLVG